MNAFLAELRRECLLAWRKGALALTPVAFFALAVVLFGLAASPNASLAYAHGAVWVLALFANTLAADALFARDHEDGTLELVLLHARPLFAAVLGKLLGHWAISALPLLALSPLALFVLQGSLAGTGTLLAALALATPTLACVSGIGAALTVGTGRQGLLLALLSLPLAVPVLVFGLGASLGGPQAPFSLLMLAALLAAAATAAPFAIAKALAIAQEY